MKVHHSQTPEELGREAAALTVRLIDEAIEERGEARLMLSTGASQFELFKNLIEADIDWGKVVLFHLDEYVDLPEDHRASFRLYLQERFLSKIDTPKAVYLVDGNTDPEAEINRLHEAIRQAPIDVALIGIGTNAHVAFNDPPADFETQEDFHVVNLDSRCKQQQVDEGWFASVDDVPNRAISATVSQVMSSRTIISAVPFAVKAEAIRNMWEAETPDPEVPASILKTHPDFHLFVDAESGKDIRETA